MTTANMDEMDMRGYMVSCDVCEAHTVCFDCGAGGAHGSMWLCESCVTTPEAREVNADDPDAMACIDAAEAFFAKRSGS